MTTAAQNQVLGRLLTGIALVGLLLQCLLIFLPTPASAIVAVESGMGFSAPGHAMAAMGHNVVDCADDGTLCSQTTDCAQHCFAAASAMPGLPSVLSWNLVVIAIVIVTFAFSWFRPARPDPAPSFFHPPRYAFLTVRLLE
jgi:hypothetical protein